MAIYTYKQALEKSGSKASDVKSLGVNPTDEKTNSEQLPAVELAKGAAKSVLSSVEDVQGLGVSVANKVLPGYKDLNDKEKGLETFKQDLSSSNTTQKVGKVAETIGEFLIPFAKTEAIGGAIDKAATKAKGAIQPAMDAAKKAPEALGDLSKAILGEADAATVKAGQNPMTKLFKSGKAKVSDVVKTVDEGIQGVITKSKEELKAVKDSIPEIEVGAQKIGEKVNQGIMNSIQNAADYKGVKGAFETVDDILDSGILKPEETKRLQDAVKFIGKWKDTSARGVLNLKEALVNFYATGEGYTGSNAVIRSIQRNLVDLVGEHAPEIKGALKKASQNIDKVEEFGKHLLGKDSVSGESKIISLAKGLADKAKNGYKINLVKELEKEMGTKITPYLQGIADYLESGKLKAPGLQQPLETLKFVLKKGIEKYVPLK